jgi:hypothetical protein
MFNPSRHYPVKNIKWEPVLVQQTIQEIADDALTQLNQNGKLPRHPLDDYGESSDL